MAARVRFKVVPGAVPKLLKGDEVAAGLEELGRQIAAAAGPGHEVAIDHGPHRVRVTVATATLDAILAEARSRNLTRALDAARR